MLNQLVHFLEIKVDWLTAKTIYDFPLYLFDVRSKKRFLAYVKDFELTSDLYDKLLEYQAKGAKILLPRSYSKEFILHLEPSEEEKLNLINKVDLDLEQLYLERNLDLDSSLNEFKLGQHLAQALNANDFKVIIDQVKQEVKLFDPFVNIEVSTLWRDVETFLNKDSSLNRDVCLAYFLAKTTGLKQQEELTSLIFATYFRDLGVSQIDFESLATGENDYKRHPIFSIYLLSKQKFEFSQVTKRIILEHHEISNGLGYPRGKKDSFIHPLSYILGLVQRLSPALKKGNLSEYRSRLSKIGAGSYPEELLAKAKTWISS